MLLVCIIWKVDCLASCWKLAALSPWKELGVILMIRGMGNISSIPVVMQPFRVRCTAQAGSPVLWIHVGSLLLSKAECCLPSPCRLGAWLVAAGSESVLGRVIRCWEEQVGRGEDDRELLHGHVGSWHRVGTQQWVWG